MLYLLNPRIWIGAALVLLLVFSHISSYRAGAKEVKLRWDADRARQTQLALEQEQMFRRKEQDLIAQRDELEKKYAEAKRKAAVAATGARTELDGLRNVLATRDRAAAQDPAASCGADGPARLERDILGSCASALVGVAAEADRLEAVVVGLQGYIQNVCLKAN